MEKQIITKLTKHFEDSSFEEEGVEFWFVRDLQKLLGYEDLRNFLKVVEKAKESCENAKFDVLDHFVDVNKMVTLGSGSQREVKDIILTRYACYLIAQNGDSRKEEIAFAQSYFAIQTRKQEIIEERIALKERLNARKKLVKSEIELSQLIYERGVDGKGFARILNGRKDIKLFVKLPTWFKIQTPLGTYNPDWAIVKEEDETLYLVKETKGTLDYTQLRNSEEQKIHCGEKHFESLNSGVKFGVVVYGRQV